MLLIFPSLAYAIVLIALLAMSKKIARSHHDQQDKDQDGVTQATSNLRKRESIPLQITIFILLVLHGVVCFQDIVTPEGIVFGFAQALSLMAWVGVALYWIEGWYFNLRSMMPMIISLAMLSSFLPTIYQGALLSTEAVISHGFILHFITANMAVGVLFLSAVQAILIGWQEKNLRAQLKDRPADKFNFSDVLLLGQKKGLLEQLPPLVTMEKVLFNMISIGYVLLTIGVFSGVFFSQELFGKPLIFDHKTIFSILSWMLFGWILFVHWKHGLRGSQALKWIIGSFAILLLSYVGSRFVLEVILQRA